MSARFPSAEILRRLGMPDPEVFDARAGTLIPTMQILDLSRSVATEPVEARGYCRAISQAVAGQFTTWQLHCRAPGGTLIERFRLIQPDPGAIGVWCAVIPGVVAEPLPLAPTPISVGGIRVMTQHAIGPTVVLRPGAPLVPWQELHSLGTSGLGVLDTFGIYVPAGDVFIVQPGAAALLEVAAAWRELPEIQG